MTFNIWDFCMLIITTLSNAFESVFKILNYKIPIGWLINAVNKVLELLKVGTLPIDIPNELSILTLGGVALGGVILFVVIKKVIPIL